MTLHLYFARKFVMIFGGIFGIFLILFLLIDLIEKLNEFGNTASFREILLLLFLNMPEGLYTIMPLIMIIAAITLFLGLSRSSELVVARAAGRSTMSALMAPLTVSVLIGALTVAMFNPIVAATSKQFTTLSEQYRSGGREVFSLSPEGLWLRQGDEEGQTVIRAARANSDGTILYDVTFVSYRNDAGPRERIQAKVATLIDGAWSLKDAKIWPLKAGVNPEAAAKEYATFKVPSTLTSEGIRDRFGRPSTISIWELPSFIKQLEAAGFSARRHAVWLQMELARPLFFISLLLIAAAFTIRHVRSGVSGIPVLSAVMLGFVLFYVRNFAQVLGETGQIPILLAAWGPPVASAMLGLGILLQREDI